MSRRVGERIRQIEAKALQKMKQALVVKMSRSHSHQQKASTPGVRGALFTGPNHHQPRKLCSAAWMPGNDPQRQYEQ